MNDYQRRILSGIASNPRRVNDIPGVTGRQLHPDVLARYIAEMIDKGYVVDDNGILHITTLGRQFMDVKTDVATPRKSASWRYELYKPIQQHYRAGAMDFMNCKSKGMI